LLLLDEPTNHLDLDMRQALIEALMDYQGALVVVSHDRHLLRSIADEFYLVHDQRVEPFDGDLDDYQHWFNEQAKLASNETTKSANSVLDRKTQKKREAQFRQQTQILRQTIARQEQQMQLLQQ